MNAISLKAHSSQSLSAQSIKPANFIIKLASLMLACLLSFILSFSAHAAQSMFMTLIRRNKKHSIADLSRSCVAQSARTKIWQVLMRPLRKI
jgi:hypothetical protein